MNGKMIIFSAPSGAGKTSIVKGVLQQVKGLEFSVSACSRPVRAGEQHGVDYYFLSPDEFRQKIDNGDFLEWEEVYPGNFYGTLRSEVERIWNKGHHVIFDVDVAGGINIKSQYPGQALSFFVMPPSIDELARRLKLRGSETPQSLEQRLGKAKQEMSFSDKFDHIIVNDQLQQAISDAAGIINRFLEP
jgi:guanylate kinase